MENNEENKVEDIIYEKPKKKKSFLKGLIKFVVVVALIIVVLGLVFPGLLWAKSLGITYTTADYESIMDKLSYVKDDAPTIGLASDYEYIYGDIISVEQEFTSEEITAFINENRPDYFAVKNVQVRINKDGSIEAVGSANVDYFLNEVLGGEFSREQIKEEMPALGLLPKNVNLYVSVVGSITNNKSSLNLNAVSVQGIPIPNNMVNTNEAINIVTGGIDRVMENHNVKTGSSFESIKVENSKIIFNGKVPSSLERIKIDGSN